jgi:hypothetical protein
MTTHETQPEMTTRETQPKMTTREVQPETVVETDDPTRETVDPTGNLESREARVDSTESDGSAEKMLFADGELSGMRNRWTEVQSAFVDDPRDCVQKADGLVADVVDKLTAGFSQARSRLEEQWDRGEEVSTEDLRIALKRYREFFERLLAV